MKLWLDDVREMPDDFDVWVKTADEAIKYIDTGKVNFISFDHDLGEEETGYDVAVYIALKAFHNEIPRIEYVVHSANPVGRENIIFAMKNAQKFWRQYEENENE